MATEHKFRRNGKVYRRIAFKVNSKLQRINCGPLGKKPFGKLLTLVDDIEGLKSVGGQLDETMKGRLASVDKKYIDQMVRVRLLRPPNPIQIFSAIAEQYVTNKLKNGEIITTTAEAYRGTYKLFTECIGDLRLDKITSDTILDFRVERLKSVEQSTIGTDLKRVKSLQTYAKEKSLISHDPFIDIEIPSQVLKQDKADIQEQAINAAVLNDLINGCLDHEWKILISIIRWTGCRIGEALILRWSDIKWDDKEIFMRSPKTARYDKKNRTMPLWAPLREQLAEFRLISSGRPHILNNILNLSSIPEFDNSKAVGKSNYNCRYRTSTYSDMKEIMEKAGVSWPQQCQAIRKFRRNELERAGYRPVDLDAWLGHDEQTAARYYSRSQQQDRIKAADDLTGGCSDIIVAGGTHSVSGKPVKSREGLTNTKKTAFSYYQRKYKKLLNLFQRRASKKGLKPLNL